MQAKFKVGDIVEDWCDDVCVGVCTVLEIEEIACNSIIGLEMEKENLNHQVW